MKLTTLNDGLEALWKAVELLHQLNLNQVTLNYSGGEFK